MSANSSLPYMGSKISLITRALIRYEGILVNINTVQHTVTLVNVRSFGTEDRLIGAEASPPSNEIFECIVFKGKQIKDITVSELAAPDDPAIVAINPFHTPTGSSRAASGTAGMQGDGSSMMHHSHHSSHHAPMGGANTFAGGVGPNMMQSAGRSGRDQSGQAAMAAYMMGNGQQSMMGLNGGASANQMDFYLDQTGPSTYQGGHDRMDYGSNRMNNGRKTGSYMLHHQGGNGGHQMYQNHHHRGSYGRYHQHNYYPNRVVGELQAQPNSSLKVMVESAFNFEEANSKFDKSSISQIAESNEGEKSEDTANPLYKVEGIYDQTTFFDHISCESLDRQNGHHIKVDPSKQRELDLETFGSTARQGRGGRSIGYRGGGNYYYQHRNHRMYGGHQNYMPISNQVPMGVNYLQMNSQSASFHPTAAVGATQF